MANQQNGFDRKQVWMSEGATMSSVGITTALSNLSNAAQVASTAKSSPEASTAPAAQASATLKPDVVELSVAGQAKQMHQQGKSASLIAASLGVKVADVDGYLGIKVATTAAATPAASSSPTESAPTAAPAAKAEQPAATVPASTTAQPAAQPVVVAAPAAKG
jgi:hypothetical protein